VELTDIVVGFVTSPSEQPTAETDARRQNSLDTGVKRLLAMALACMAVLCFRGDLPRSPVWSDWITYQPCRPESCCAINFGCGAGGSPWSVPPTASNVNASLQSLASRLPATAAERPAAVLNRLKPKQRGQHGTYPDALVV
jgi:hypothetical protein